LAETRHQLRQLLPEARQKLPRTLRHWTAKLTDGYWCGLFTLMKPGDYLTLSSGMSFGRMRHRLSVLSGVTAEAAYIVVQRVRLDYAARELLAPRVCYRFHWRCAAILNASTKEQTQHHVFDAMVI